MLKIMIIIIAIVLLPTNCKAFEISAKSACLIVADSGEVIFEKNSCERLPMASTTKMMTALVAAESGRWDEVVTVSKNAESQEGSRIYLEANDKISLSDLVSGMLLNSGNDAAVAVSEHISGDVKSFSELMCERAVKIGAVNTSFENPSGLDSENHYSTAYDLALIGSEVIKNPRIRPIIQSKEMQIQDDEGNITYLRNHNKLLWSYDGLIGVKTGYTKKSGRCLVTAAERNGVTLVAVTLSAPDDWRDHKALLDYGFERTERTVVVEKEDSFGTVMVGKSEIDVIAKEDVTVCGIRQKREEREIKTSFIKKPKAPINKGDKLGVLKVLQNGRVVGETDLIADEAVYEADSKKNFWDFFKGLFIK